MNWLYWKTDFLWRWKSLLFEQDAPRTFIASKEKSMPDFSASKDRLTLLLVVMELVTWSECSLTIWKVPRPLKVMLKWFCLCCINGTIKSVYTSVYNLLYWIVNPLLRTTTQKEKKEKKDSFQNIALHW